MIAWLVGWVGGCRRTRGRAACCSWCEGWVGGCEGWVGDCLVGWVGGWVQENKGQGSVLFHQCAREGGGWVLGGRVRAAGPHARTLFNLPSPPRACEGAVHCWGGADAACHGDGNGSWRHLWAGGGHAAGVGGQQRGAGHRVCHRQVRGGGAAVWGGGGGGAGAVGGWVWVGGWAALWLGHRCVRATRLRSGPANHPIHPPTHPASPPTSIHPPTLLTHPPTPHTGTCCATWWSHT